MFRLLENINKLKIELKTNNKLKMKDKTDKIIYISKILIKFRV